MKKYVGIWLDHKKANIVSMIKEDLEPAGYKEINEFVESNADRKVRLSGGSRSRKTPYGPQEIAVDSKIEDRFKRQLKYYYHCIIKKIEDADRIYIFGPGEAKIELKKEIEKKREFVFKKLYVETTDKMTEKQIAARVRLFFARYR